jgi:hypothetical protein
VTWIPDRPARRADVVLRELGTEAMLYDPAADRVVRLNGTAQRIWSCCDGSRDVKAIVAELCAAFPAVEAAELEEDVRRTLRAFADAGLLLAPQGGPRPDRGPGPFVAS